MDEEDLAIQAMIAADPQQQPQPEAPQAAGGVGGGLLDTIGSAARGIREAITPDVVEKTQAAIGDGALKAGFETKDFLTGATADADKSTLRKNVEAESKALSEESIGYGIAGTISQFATGMIGLGKATEAAKLLPWFGRAAKVVTSTKAGVVAAETAKAAAVGAAAFDPYEGRLSNLVQGTPLANPVTGFLAADPNDSRAVARMKSAMESIGLDAGIIAGFTVGGRAYKWLLHGNAEEASKAADELVKVQAREGVPARNDNIGGSANATAEITPPASFDPTVGATGVAPAANDAAVGPTVQAFDTPTAAAASEGIALPGGKAVGFKPPTEEAVDTLDAEGILAGMQADTEAVLKYGDGAWYGEHTFGKGPGVPWVKLNGTPELDNFMARLVDSRKAELDALKGGDVMSDAKVKRMADQRAALYGEDPAVFMGLLQRDAKAANSMAATVETGFLVTQRMMQDSFALANRLQLGDLREFNGSREAGVTELKKRLALAAEVYGNTRAITANVGRTLRRQQAQFKLDPEAIKALGELDGAQLTDLLVNSQGNPRTLAKLVNPDMWTRMRDYGQYVLVNNLVSGPKTQLINILGNGYMMGARPLEKMLGGSTQYLKAVATGDGAGKGSANRIVREAASQYGFMKASYRDAFAQAVKSFVRNDSVLAPHRSEMYRQGVAMNGPVSWKPMDSPQGILWNTAMAAHTAIGLPTRSLGFVDELVQQTVYRSKVLAKAQVDGIDAAMQAGIPVKERGAYVKQFMEDKLEAAFDDLGQAVDLDALREAKTSAFQQDLQPGTLGRSVQNFANSYPLAKVVLPFIKTPTNVLRYGWKMTPGLNALQTEFRDAITGRLGAEMQAEAIGQHAIGSAFFATAGILAAEGKFTGGGPTDYKLRQELLATGWQPYSFVSTDPKTGTKTFTPFGRYDPVAMPFGIMADLVDYMHAAERSGDDDVGIGDALAATFMALTKQFRNKTYLMNVQGAIEAIEASDGTADAGARLLGQMAGNMVPFSALQRQVNPDATLREARDVVDRIKSTIPGLSESIPAKYDVWGDPITAYSRNFLQSSKEANDVDTEVQRLAIENGSALTRVQPKPQGGVDLRDITMVNGKNAYEEYQRMAGHLNGKGQSLKQAVARVINTGAYKRAPDGGAGVKGTKLWIMSGVADRYRQAAMSMLKVDKNVRDALMKSQLEVADHYAGRAPATTKTSPLESIGAAFGLDLSGLTQPQ